MRSLVSLRSASAPLAALLLTLAAGCQMRLVSDYDETIDRGTSELQHGLEELLIRMRHAAATTDPEDGAYGAFAHEYDALEADLRVLETRRSTSSSRG